MGSAPALARGRNRSGSGRGRGRRRSRAWRCWWRSRRDFAAYRICWVARHGRPVGVAVHRGNAIGPLPLKGPRNAAVATVSAWSSYVPEKCIVPPGLQISRAVYKTQPRAGTGQTQGRYSATDRRRRSGASVGVLSGEVGGSSQPSQAYCGRTMRNDAIDTLTLAESN